MGPQETFFMLEAVYTRWLSQAPTSIQVTTAIAEKTVRLLKSAIAVVSAKAVVACIKKQCARVGRLEILIKKAPSSEKPKRLSN